MRNDASDGAVWLLLVVGLGLLALAPVLARHPDLFARKNFPFNIGHDESVPRRWIVAMAIGGIGLVFAVFGVILLET